MKEKSRMNRLSFLVGLLCASSLHAADSVDFGGQVIAVGDSAAVLVVLAGMPAHRQSIQGTPPYFGDVGPLGSREMQKVDGERWRYERDGKALQFTIRNGKIAAIVDAE